MNSFSTSTAVIIACAAHAIASAGCSADPTPSLSAAPDEALRSRFPSQAPEVLDSKSAFIATERGFTLGSAAESGDRRMIYAKLPRNASEGE
jgi:hypothetical protein